MSYSTDTNARMLLEYKEAFFTIGYFVIAISVLYKGIQLALGKTHPQETFNYICLFAFVAFSLAMLPKSALKLEESINYMRKEKSEQVLCVLKNIKMVQRDKQSKLDFLTPMINALNQVVVTVNFFMKEVIERVFKYVLVCILTASPLWLAFIMFDITRSLGIRMYLLTFSLCILPVMFVFGDIFILEMMPYIAAFCGLVAGVAAGKALLAGLMTAAAATGGTALIAGGAMIASAPIAALLGFSVGILGILIIINIAIPIFFLRFMQSADVLNGLGYMGTNFKGLTAKKK